MNALLAEQLCTTPYTKINETTTPAEPGQMVAWRASCQRYAPSLTP
jgi:hypothetical protein